ncbi:MULTISPECIES: hypothetical protein [Moorena]|uniref:Uncharacterized protein n=2 Tax=Moorena producens TaxID=1155739 RepID=A0A1D9FUE2_MOOP1|nr:MULTISPECIES: hypothetical protein [Moorena]AOY78967.1 hypothetical protein BJP36_02655 [Moorena producens JHB]EGJ28712.1 hypothetical protein LYNGBM3L_71450 [Moorena producens 3L]NER87182.1 hypothetical protein [Moorena sp. SIO3A2]OLT63904.1 hypothetical protein BI334_01670 [Moorena producens 3L]
MQELACEPDAWAGLDQFEQRLPWHRLETRTVVSKPHYQKRGKPKARTQPNDITYHVQAHGSRSWRKTPRPLRCA